MTIQVVVDGGSLGNGTKDSVGYGSYCIDTPVRPEFGTGITNNEAEYMALIAALDHIISTMNSAKLNPTGYDVEIHTDSQLLVGHLTQGWKVKAVNLRPLVDRARILMGSFRNCTLVKVPRDEIVRTLGH